MSGLPNGDKEKPRGHEPRGLLRQQVAILQTRNSLTTNPMSGSLNSVGFSGSEWPPDFGIYPILRSLLQRHPTPKCGRLGLEALFRLALTSCLYFSTLRGVCQVLLLDLPTSLLAALVGAEPFTVVSLKRTSRLVIKLLLTSIAFLASHVKSTEVRTD